MRFLRVLGLLCFLPFLLGSNTHVGTTDATSEMRAWFGDAGRGYVVTGCALGTSANQTTTVTGCAAYVDAANGSLVYVSQGSVAVGPLLGGNATYWVAVHTDVATAVSGWTRQAGTHFLWKASATLPTPPSNVLVLGSVLVTGTTVSSPTSAVNRTLLPASAILGWTSALEYGVRADGVTDDAPALTAALAAGKPVLLPCGVMLLGSTVALPVGTNLRGCGQGNETGTAPTSTVLRSAAASVLEIVTSTPGTTEYMGSTLSDLAMEGLSGNAQGLRISGAAQVHLARVTFVGHGATNVGFTTAALTIEANGAGVSSHLSLRDVTVADSNQDGVVLSGVRHARLEGCHFVGTTRHAVTLSGTGSTGLTLSGNDFINSGTTDVQVATPVAGLVLQGNAFRFATTAPPVQLLLQGDATLGGTVIQGNAFTGNGSSTAIQLGNGTGPTGVQIRGNAFASLGIGVSFAQPATDTVVEGNTFATVTAPVAGVPGTGTVVVLPQAAVVTKLYGRTSTTPVVNTTTETTIGTATIGAGIVLQDGGIRVRAFGVYRNSSGTDKVLTLRVKFAGTTMLSCPMTAITTATGYRNWSLELWLGGNGDSPLNFHSSGLCQLSPETSASGVAAALTTQLFGGLDTVPISTGENAQPFLLTAQHDAAASTVELVLHHLTLEHLPRFQTAP